MIFGSSRPCLMSHLTVSHLRRPSLRKSAESVLKNCTELELKHISAHRKGRQGKWKDENKSNIHNLLLLYVPSFSICIKRISVQQAVVCQYKELDSPLVSSWKIHPKQTYHSIRPSRSCHTKKDFWWVVKRDLCLFPLFLLV